MPPATAFTGFTTTGGNSSDSTQFNVTNSFATDAGWKFKRNDNDTAGNFFPASGYRNYSSGGLNYVGSSGYYWSAAPASAASAYYLYFGAGVVNPLNNINRAYGFSVRPVRE